MQGTTLANGNAHRGIIIDSRVEGQSFYSTIYGIMWLGTRTGPHSNSHWHTHLWTFSFGFVCRLLLSFACEV